MSKKASSKPKKSIKKTKKSGVDELEASVSEEVNESTALAVVEDDFRPEVQPLVVEGDDSFEMSSDEARKRVLTLREHMTDEYVELCRILFHVHRKQMYSAWGFGTFDEYVASELEFEKSKARYLVQVWECLYERQGDKSVFKKVIALGWTKATILMKIINAENVDEWVEKAKHMSCDILRKEVKKLLDQKISDDPSEALASADEVEGTNMELAMKTMNLQLHHDDYLAICQAVERMQSMEPGVSISQAIALMARDFMSSVPPEDLNNPKAAFVELLKKYESNSDLKIVIIDPEQKQVLHGFEALESIVSEDGGGELDESEVVDVSSEVPVLEGDDIFN